MNGVYVIWTPKKTVVNDDGTFEEKAMGGKEDITVFVQPGGPKTVKVYDGNGKELNLDDLRFDFSEGGLEGTFSQNPQDDFFKFEKLTGEKKKMLKDEYGINA